MGVGLAAWFPVEDEEEGGGGRRYVKREGGRHDVTLPSLSHYR